MAKWNYYACRDKEGKGQVFENWEACQKAIKGVKGITYRGFKSKLEAEEYAGVINKNTLPILDTTPIINHYQKSTHAIPCISVDEYCHKYNFNHFTQEQRDAIATTDGKALLFAVPGSGKTTVIMARTGYLIHACNVNPKEIVTLTFTKAAAEEMENRYYENFPTDKGLANFRTIHSFCWNIILPELRSKGFYYPKHLIGGTNQSAAEEQTFTQAKIIKMVLKDCCGVTKTNDEASQNKIINAITGVKNNIILPKDLGTIFIRKKPIKVADVYSYYQQLLQQHSILDFDDMLRYSYEGLKKHPEVLFELQERYKYWSIDEAQDNSELQYELIRLLVGENGNLYMVGDDDQSIYSFRAAKPSLMFEKFGSQTDVKKLHMSTNFRSDCSIVKASKALVSMNVNREPKRMEHKESAETGTFNIGVNFINECAEYKHIVKEAKEAIENNKSLAVLYRFNTSSLPIITYFYKNNIPYMSSKGISDVLCGLSINTALCYLKCSQNQKDFDTIYKHLKHLGIYLNKKYTKELLKASCENSPNNTVLENIRLVLDDDSSNQEIVVKCNDLLKKIEKVKPSIAISTVFANTPILGNDSISDRLKGYALISSAELFDTISEFLAALKEIKAKEKQVVSLKNTELQEDDESVATTEKPLIYLSSIHSAKGKQYDHVIIIDCFDEVMPGRPQPDNINYDPEEERRLFYVAVTRAKHRLDILTVEKYHNNPELPSRFIFDLSLICKILGIPTQSDFEDDINQDSTPFIFTKKVKEESVDEQSTPIKIFISYSSKERNIADKVKLYLQSIGMDCWMAPNSISPGSNYTKEIPTAISNSNAVVLILSKFAQESNWVPKEIDSAINKGVKIIPLQIDDKPLNEQFGFMLSQSQRIDAHNRFSLALDDLKKALTV